MIFPAEEVALFVHENYTDLQRLQSHREDDLPLA